MIQLNLTGSLNLSYREQTIEWGRETSQEATGNNSKKKKKDYDGQDQGGRSEDNEKLSDSGCIFEVRIHSIAGLM